jgi:hypothetical protein
MIFKTKWGSVIVMINKWYKSKGFSHKARYGGGNSISRKWEMK